MTATIHRGDLLEHMRGNEWLVLNGYIPKAHAVLCDPPYGLAFMNQQWDAMNAVEYQAWCEEWGRLLLSFVYPGAVMLAFGGTRTYHRLAAGLEDAGWIVGDSLIWTYSSGFPKSHSISRAIDKAAFVPCPECLGDGGLVVAGDRGISDYKRVPCEVCDGTGRKKGAERTKAEWYDKYHDGITRTEQDLGVSHVGFSTNRAANTNIRSLPATPAAIQWDGYGTALCPSYEPILLARAPWSGTYAGIAQEHGTAALAIDRARITLNPPAPLPDVGVFVHGGELVLRVSGDIYDLSRVPCQDVLQHILFALRSYNTDDKAPWHNASDLRGNLPYAHQDARTIHARLFPNGVWCGLPLRAILNSQVGCQSCHHFYDELFRSFQAGDPITETSLIDVLSHIYRRLNEPSHNHSQTDSDHSVCLTMQAYCYSLVFTLLMGRIIPYLAPPVQGENLVRSPIQRDDNQIYGKGLGNGVQTNPAGRWPKNLLLSCACESDEHDAGCPVRIMGEQSGDVKSSGLSPSKYGSPNHIYGGGIGLQQGQLYDDSGTAARMFYQAKASKWEREAGLHKRAPQTVNDTPHMRGETKRLNTHSTVKPIQLTEYLAKLLLPPELDTPRILLNPFTGSGSEIIGAKLAGWDNVIGFEQSDEYATIAEARIAWWAQFADYEQAKRAWDADNVEAQQRTAELAAGVQQLAMFEESVT